MGGRTIPHYSIICADVPKVAATYAIRNVHTGREYFGCTVNLYIRIKKHFGTLAAATHANVDMQADYNKYGIDGFEVYILEYGKNPTLESVLIKTADDCYNQVGRVGFAKCRFNHVDHREMMAMSKAGIQLKFIAEAFDAHKSYVCRVLSNTQAKSITAAQKLFDKKGNFRPPKTQRVLVFPTHK